jgi:hypothetical protein
MASLPSIFVSVSLSRVLFQYRSPLKNNILSSVKGEV